MREIDDLESQTEGKRAHARYPTVCENVDGFEHIPVDTGWIEDEEDHY